MTTIIIAENTDIYMDEQTSLNVVVNTANSDGTPRDITGGTVTWKAFANGVETIKKDTPTMLVMLAPVTSTLVTSTTNSGQNAIILDKVAGFGADSWGRPIANFAIGDTVTISTGSISEYNTIAGIDTNTLTMVNPLSNRYLTGDIVSKIISQFSFQLLPGDTILPVTKSYGTPIIWEHLAIVTFPVGLSPANIYQQSTSVVGVRGRMFILPIPDMS